MKDKDNKHTMTYEEYKSMFGFVWIDWISKLSNEDYQKVIELGKMVQEVENHIPYKKSKIGK